ncbi:sulfocyanin-like copper-binding protein [Rhodobacter ferrooxidans]|uniref:sulfocyanin-like copper-binding protein n=1 Tax=Rhodobacter ferrooxidans TaxID=371731 RepID=UPI0018DE72C5|nr:sulfocyanin-like copper-binding protein [Rhodobacter sp. SW2]
MKRVFKYVLLPGALMAALAAPVLADTTVQAFLWDADQMENLATDLALGGTGDHSTAKFGVALSTDTVPAGKVTLAVTNMSENMFHEMLISPVPASGTLPLDPATGRVDEATGGSLGEVAEIEPGAKGTLTVDLTPGQYVVYCNLPGHWNAGMWSVLTVK